MQYSKPFTDALQFMWGEGFLSPGGPEEVADMLRGRDISGKRILDIGSGLGGVDILLVSSHGASEDRRGSGRCRRDFVKSDSPDLRILRHRRSPRSASPIVSGELAHIPGADDIIDLRLVGRKPPIGG